MSETHRPRWLLDAYEGRPSIEVNDAAVPAIEQAVERGLDAALKRLAGRRSDRD